MMETARSVTRKIVDFDTDEHGDWIAQLECGHRQHVRHNPPLVSRAWVTTPEGRASRIGAELNCNLCDRAAGFAYLGDVAA
jgi:hypothetical protein